MYNKASLLMTNFQLNKTKIFMYLLCGVIFLNLMVSVKTVNVDVVDILARVGIVAPSWIVNLITGLGSVAAIITALGTLGSGIPLSVLEELAAAGTAAA